MITTLTLFQTTSLIIYLVLAMMLMICPYKGEEFDNYHRSRRLFMTSMFVIGSQFAAQLLFGFRAKDPALGTAVNLLFFTFADTLYTMGVFRLLRGTRSCRREWTTLITYSILNAVILLPAMAFSWQTATFRWIVWGCTAAYVAVFIAAFFILLKEYNRLRKSIEDNCALPLEKETEWIRLFLFFRLAYCLLAPCLAISSHFSILFSMACFSAFAYAEVKFIYYGYFIGTIEAVDETKTDEDEKSIDHDIAQFQSVGSLLKKWKKEERYCQKDVTLVSLAQDLQIQHKIVSAYFTTMEETTFREWINDLRLEKAKTLILSDPPLNNETIASNCGFSSRSFFQNYFRDKEGMTPGEWRSRKK